MVKATPLTVQALGDGAACMNASMRMTAFEVEIEPLRWALLVNDCSDVSSFTLVLNWAILVNDAPNDTSCTSSCLISGGNPLPLMTTIPVSAREPAGPLASIVLKLANTLAQFRATVTPEALNRGVSLLLRKPPVSEV